MTDEKKILKPTSVVEGVVSTTAPWLGKLATLFLTLVLLSAMIWSLYVFGVTLYKNYLEIPTEVKVPDITNMEIKEAYDMIEKAGLKIQVHESRFDKKIKKRVVLSQDPQGEKMVRSGRTILVVVSLGPELIKVPKLIGEPLRTAKIALSNKKLRLGDVEFQSASYGQDEGIVKQNPSAGKEVPRGQKVHFVVRRGWR